MNPVTLMSDVLYRLMRPVFFRRSAQDTHEALLKRLSAWDDSSAMVRAAALHRRLTMSNVPLTVGGAALRHPLMMAAGFVKGMGFSDEAAALRAVDAGYNILPGWHIVPALVGQVEFGSYTRHPRCGSDGQTVWRHAARHSLQNRVGLRNPGAAAAARFLSHRRTALPAVCGINIAVTPGLHDPGQQREEIVEALSLFLEAELRPAWFTLNLSCPNTGDDPTGYQTESLTRILCDALGQRLRAQTPRPALWLKVSPALSEAQYRAIVEAASVTGVKGIIATNTLSQPVPGTLTTAGLSGAGLRPHALNAAAAIQRLRYDMAAPLDVIASGGILTGRDLVAYRALGVYAAQCWSAFVFRGPAALAIIESETHAL